MSRDQSKSNFWIQSTLPVSDRVGRELTVEWASGPSVGLVAAGASGTLHCGTGVSMVRSGECLRTAAVPQVTPCS